MKFLYIGEFPDGVDHINAYGVRFARDVAMDVPEKFVGKFLGNRYFAEAAGDAAPVTSDVATGEPDEKTQLMAIAQASGVKIDKRWSVQRIRDAIEGAA